MALERKWLAIAPVPFTANGTDLGVVTVADTIYFKDKMLVYIQSNTVPQTQYQIKQVISSTQFVVGRVDNKLGVNNYQNISQFLVSDDATVAATEQDKLAKPMDTDHYFGIYESSPINADRVIPVDPYGDFYDTSNPLPVAFEGSISIGAVEVKGTNGNYIEPNPDGSINVIVEAVPSPNSTVVNTYNEVSAVASNATTQLVSYTVPVGYQAIIQRLTFSGDNIGRYDFLINSSIQDRTRTMFGSDLSGQFYWETGNDSGFILNAGDIATIQVFNPRPYSAAYEARIQVLKIPA